MAESKSTAPDAAQADNSERSDKLPARLARHLHDLHNQAMELQELAHVISLDISGVDTTIIGAIAERLATSLNDGLDPVELGCIMEGRKCMPAPGQQEPQS